MKFAITTTADDYDPEDADKLRPYGFKFSKPNRFGRVRKLMKPGETPEVEVSTLEELIALHHALDCEIILSSSEPEGDGKRVYWIERYDDHHD